MHIVIISNTVDQISALNMNEKSQTKETITNTNNDVTINNTISLISNLDEKYDTTTQQHQV